VEHSKAGMKGNYWKIATKEEMESAESCHPRKNHRASSISELQNPDLLNDLKSSIKIVPGALNYERQPLYQRTRPPSLDRNQRIHARLLPIRPKGEVNHSEPRGDSTSSGSNNVIIVGDNFRLQRRPVSRPIENWNFLLPKIEESMFIANSEPIVVPHDVWIGTNDVNEPSFNDDTTGFYDDYTLNKFECDDIFLGQMPSLQPPPPTLDTNQRTPPTNFIEIPSLYPQQ